MIITITLLYFLHHRNIGDLFIFMTSKTDKTNELHQRWFIRYTFSNYMAAPQVHTGEKQYKSAESLENGRMSKEIELHTDL